MKKTATAKKKPLARKTVGKARRAAGEQKAVLLVNLGSPESPSVPHVRKYLKQFLMDGYVIDAPYPIRWMIVNLFVLPFRPKRSAEAYQKIWTKEGSPLLVFTRRFAEKLQKFSRHRIYWAMRYGHPSIASVLTLMRDAGHKEVLLAPLYPHYALSTTVTVLQEARLHARDLGITLSVLPPFYDNKAHQAVLARQVKHASASHDFVLFSYHGLPVSHIRKADTTGNHCLTNTNCCIVHSAAHSTCYRHQVIETTNAVARGAGLRADRYGFAFQSRLGRAEWLTPNTADFVTDLARKGIRRLAVIAPAFVADNLETLEEIDMQIREAFLAAGGEKFTYLPCLNDNTDWVKGFAGLIDRA
ncbi:MAG: ferrochelatase [Turneriella sp.]